MAVDSYITLQDGDGRKLKGPKTQIKWPGICAVDKITAFKTPNINMETLKFHLQAKVTFSRSCFNPRKHEGRGHTLTPLPPHPRIFGDKKHVILPIAKGFRTTVLCFTTHILRLF